MKILVVEDNTASRLLLKQQLDAFGNQTSDVGSLGDALALLGSDRFDLVLLDVHLPDGAGAALVYRILDQQDDCPPIIAISAGLDDDGTALLEAGVIEVWKKPVSATQLKSLSKFQSSISASGSSTRIDGELNAERGFEELQELARLAGLEAVEAVIETFFSVSEGRLESLRDAADGHDFKELVRICHSWRGIAASLGASQLNESLIRCEDAARAEDLESCEKQLLTIIAEFDLARDQLVRLSILTTITETSCNSCLATWRPGVGYSNTLMTLEKVEGPMEPRP